MGRPPRPQGQGLTYHVTARGNNRQDIFEDDVDRLSFLALAEATRKRRQWQVHAWCLMTNHLHLLVSTPEADLSAGIRDILGRYARRYNHFHERSGHLFERRFHSGLVTTDEHFLSTVRYINRNPVRAGLTDHPMYYPWSGYARGTRRSTITVDDSALLGRLHPIRTIAERRLRELIDDDDVSEPVGDRRPAIGTLLQALGPVQGARAAAHQGYTRGDIASARGISLRTLRRQLRSTVTGLGQESRRTANAR